MKAAIALMKRRQEQLRRRLRDIRNAGTQCQHDMALKAVQRVMFDHIEDELRFTEETIILLESIPSTENP